METANNLNPLLNLIERLLNSVTHPTTCAQCEYRHLAADKVPGQCPIVWTRAFANELGRLAQGVGNRIRGTHTIRFIDADTIPNNEIVTYGRLVSDLKPHKTEEQRVRLTIGGDRIDCPYGISTPVADLTTIKIHLNSVISTPKSKFFCTDIRILSE